MTSNLFLVTRADGTKAVLKLFTEIGRCDEATGSPWLDYMGGDGAVGIFAHDDGAQLLEYLEGPTLLPMVKAGQDTDVNAIFIEVIKNLHRPRSGAIPQGLVPLDIRFRELFERSGQDDFFNRAITLAKKLIATQKRSVVLHGDMHHLNVMRSERGWLAIDPKGLIGDPHYEIANIFSNPDDMSHLTLNPERHKAMAAQFAQGLGLDPQRLLAFAAVHAALSTAWSLSEELDMAAHSRAIGEVLFKILDTA